MEKGRRGICHQGAAPRSSDHRHLRPCGSRACRRSIPATRFPPPAAAPPVAISLRPILTNRAPCTPPHECPEQSEAEPQASRKLERPCSYCVLRGLDRFFAGTAVRTMRRRAIGRVCCEVRRQSIPLRAALPHARHRSTMVEARPSSRASAIIVSYRRVGQPPNVRSMRPRR